MGPSFIDYPHLLPDWSRLRSKVSAMGRREYTLLGLQKKLALYAVFVQTFIVKLRTEA
jgi:hypothetical protein